MKSKLLLMILILSVSVMGRAKDEAPFPDPGNVTLSLEEYNRLVDVAGKPVKKPDLPPLPYAVKRGDLKLHVTDEAVQGTIQLQGEVFRKGETKVPLVTDMTILDARQEGKALPLEQENGKHVAVLPGPAEFSVALDAGLPLNIEAGRASFSLPAPAAGSVRLTLVIPGDHTDVKIDPGLITARNSEAGHTTIEAALVPGKEARIWWTTREIATPAAPREMHFLSNVKTLVSVDEAELKVAALADLTVLQGEASQFAVEIPEGYEVTGASGAALESSEVQAGVLLLNVSTAAQRNYQFLISMEKPLTSSQAEAPFLSFKNNQRETGEVLVEGVGTMELTAKESGGLKRIDWKEVNPYLRSLSRFSPQAAFRYHRQPTENPGLALEWVRFADSSVLAAVAERAVVTTLVTSDGKSLSEVKLVLRNQAQPFLKVSLPKGAAILTADVAGGEVKPGIDKDGNTQVPLLRSGFRPTTEAYTVSFVFMHSGAPFAKKGGSDLVLPQMDIPISLLRWEVFLPEQYKVKDFGGDALATSLLPLPVQQSLAIDGENAKDLGAADANSIVYNSNGNFDASLLPGQLGGYVTDTSGAVIPNAQITIVDTNTNLTRNVTTDQAGRWLVSNIPSGRFKISAFLPGFKKFSREITNDASRPLNYGFTLEVGTVSETIMITSGGEADDRRDSRRAEREAKQRQQEAQNAPSANVTNLQQRVAGVLPVRVDVPRAGNSYCFVRPLVLDEETKVTFSYNSR
ncbi:MAG TPA: carboxypeptidase-like regulatory domain-containing protein [Terriglobales bacterium]|jgi:hypothetical protein|nr:carboxypeptidase-like regulatory domain-containing protein [Terriglobales bacterium]